MSEKAVALLSGGLDSTVALSRYMFNFKTHQRVDQPQPVAALSVFYGQRHNKELQSAAAVAKFFNLKHIVIDMPSLGDAIVGGSALVNKEEALPQGRSVEEMATSIPRSYVPGRNTILLALAQSVAETLEATRVICGFNAVDYSGYPDCRPEFVNAWNNLARFATKSGVEGKPISVDAPIIGMTKVEVVELGLVLLAPLELTWSCYKGEALPCAECDSCIIRAQAFEKVGIVDPATPKAPKAVTNG